MAAEETSRSANGNGNGFDLRIKHVKGLWTALIVPVATILLWMGGITYALGQRAKQLDIDTSDIASLDSNGTRGTAARLDAIERRLAELHQDNETLRQELLRIAEQRSK